MKVRSVVQFSPKALALMEKYPLMSELLTTTFVNTDYQVLGDRDYDPYALLKANLSTFLTRNQSLGKQVSTNVMLSTLATENPNDYGWNALAEAIGTFGSHKISNINFGNKYGNYILRPIISGGTGEYLGDPQRLKQNFNSLDNYLSSPTMENKKDEK
ncbi:hypothetical protein GVX76_10915 [[Haemophilus] felis]|nr:hypothetical protein [[Haemophilus] felis]